MYDPDLPGVIAFFGSAIISGLALIGVLVYTGYWIVEADAAMSWWDLALGAMLTVTFGLIGCMLLALVVYAALRIALFLLTGVLYVAVGVAVAFWWLWLFVRDTWRRCIPRPSTRS